MHLNFLQIVHIEGYFRSREFGHFFLPGYPVDCPLQYDKRNGVATTREEGKKNCFSSSGGGESKHGRSEKEERGD